MVDQIILHVGPHKTGTTAIQKALASGRAILAGQGVVYPTAGIVEHGQHKLVDAARKGQMTEDTEKLQCEISDAAKVVISSENIVHLSEESMLNLRRMFPPQVGIRVVYYLRRVTDFWLSHWQETVKHGRTEDLFRYIAQATGVVEDPRHGLNNQAAQLERLERVFGRESMVIIGYDHLRARQIDIASHFLNQVVGARGTLAPSGEVNVSLPSWVTEFLRQMNMIHRQTVGALPSARLRIDMLNALNRNEIACAGEFERAFKDQSVEVSLRNRSDAIAAMHAKTERFRDRVMDSDAALAAYAEDASRRVHVADPAVSDFSAMRTPMMDLYQSRQTPHWRI